MSTMASTAAHAQDWPSFRGPDHSGVADGAQPPTEWDVEKSLNVRWKTPITGLAHASPIVWGDRLFVTTAVVLTDADRMQLAEAGDDETEIMRRIGIARAERVGETLQEALQYPSLNVRGLEAGGVGARAANAIPSEAVPRSTFARRPRPMAGGCTSS